MSYSFDFYLLLCQDELTISREDCLFRIVFGLHFLLDIGSLDIALAALQPTPKRLGAAGAYTTLHAGDKRSITLYLFCERTAAITPNRPVRRSDLEKINVRYHGLVSSVILPKSY
jgi:hypothetical protein